MRMDRQPSGHSNVCPTVTTTPISGAPAQWGLRRPITGEGRAIIMAADRGSGIDIPALYTAHRLHLIRLAALLVDDIGLAEDVVQEAFIGLSRHQHQLRDPNAAIGYLRTSVVNGSRSVLRRRRTVNTYFATVTAPPDEAPADTAVLARERQNAVYGAVQQLPQRMREVLVLRYWSDLSEAQIAAALGISEGTVKSTASRAIAKLGIALGGLR